MDWDEVSSRWEQLSISAKENWSKLTDADLASISGSRESLAGKIQQTYGVSRREADKQVWDWGRSVQRIRKTIA